MEISGSSSPTEPLLDPNPNPISTPRSVTTKVPEVEIQLYQRGRGPIAVFPSPLGGWDRDLLEVQDILDKHHLKSLFSFSPAAGRGAPIRFNARTGRSLLPYSDGSTILLDGEPQDSMVKPVTKILVGVAVLTLLIAVFVRETPEWMGRAGLTGGKFPPWILACVVIVFTRMRKRTKDLLRKFGW